MPINICNKGHITGFRHCPQCGSDTIRQVPPYTVRDPQPVVERVKRPALIQRFMLPFKVWRNRHRERLAAMAAA
jgi:hypothetical protein